MIWADINEHYSELFPREIPTQRRVVETPTGTKEVETDEIIDDPITTVEEVEENEETEQEDNGDN